jgi:hypothetical protein
MVMKMNKKYLVTICGLLLIIIGSLPLSCVPNIKPNPTPQINLDIEKPTNEILSLVSPINLLVTNNEDRAKFAVLNYCFSKRVNNYETTSQKMQDIYVLAAQYYLKDSMDNKYKDLDKKMVDLFVKLVGDDDHILTVDEKINVQNTFGGLAWSLIK